MTGLCIILIDAVVARQMTQKKGHLVVYTPTCAAEYKRHRKVQVGKDQEKAQSEKDSHSKNRGGKKPN